MSTKPLLPAWQSALYRSILLFVPLVALSISDRFIYLPHWRDWTDPMATALVEWSAKWLWGINYSFISGLHSDSLGSYIHVGNMALIALLLGGIWQYWKREALSTKTWAWFNSFVAYYIAWQLLLYGFNKVFKYQFFLPEPNTLYTTVGQTPRDLLFWSAMGASYGYTVFAGILEVLAAILLLFRPTRLLGALLSAGIMANVLAINLGFNISVKLLSSFLLGLSLILIAPYGKQLYNLLIHKTGTAPHPYAPNLHTNTKTRWQQLAKIIVLWCLFFEVLGPYFEQQNFNDDLQARPAFHGAYEVLSFVQDDFSLSAVYPQRWKRAFVHRRGFFIVQNMQEEFQDYYFDYDEESQLFQLAHTGTKETYYFDYTIDNKGHLLLSGTMKEHLYEIRLAPLDWRSLPLLQAPFHWTIDAINPPWTPVPVEE